MKISPVSAYGGSQVYISPMHYPVENTSNVSAGFAESIRRNSGKYAVGASSPVIYPDHTAVSSGPKKGSKEARRIEEAFNRIASDHYGETTSYGPEGQGFGYEAAGRVFDMFV